MIERLALLLCLFLGMTGCRTAQNGADGGPRQTATFDVKHQITITVPPDANRVQAWIAMPHLADPNQEVSHWRVECPHPTRVVTDNHGNSFLLLEADSPMAGPLLVKTSFTVKRYEIRPSLDPARTRQHNSNDLETLGTYLSGDSHSIINDNAQQLAERATGGQRNPLIAARAIYDAVVATTDNLDLPSLFGAVARAAQIPTRVVYGSTLDARTRQPAVWMECHAPDLGWIPVDVMAPEFGRLDPRRVTWHYNRDLLMTPRQAGEPIEWNTTAYIEIDGETYTQFTRKLTYEGR